MNSIPSWALRLREPVGVLAVLSGTILIVLDKPVASDYYFPIIWYGYILTLDGFRSRMGRISLIGDSPLLFLLMIPVSAACWWVFEAFNVAVGNWRYVGGGSFTEVSYILLASVSFSTVLPAIWETAMALNDVARSLIWLHLEQVSPYRHSVDDGSPIEATGRGRQSWLPVSLDSLMRCSLVAGVLSIILPVFLPRYAFGLIWISLFFLLDPVNFWLCRSSLLSDMWHGRFGTAAAFALAGPLCGLFWESWNYWAPVKWVYSVPFVSQWHLFEMPVPGYAGYVPFGLELFAMSVFILPACSRLLVQSSFATGNIGDNWTTTRPVHGVCLKTDPS